MELGAMTPDQGGPTPFELCVPHGRIVLERAGGRCLVRFAGEIDIAFRRDEFARLTAAVRASGLAVDVDCSGVTFFSAEGISMLALLQSAAVDRRIGALVTSAALDRLGRAYPMDSFSVAA